MPPAGPDPFRCTPEEHHALEVRWSDGQMLHYAEWLLEFVARHREDIVAAAAGSPEPEILLAATKHLIAHRGSMHAGSEMRDQLREIANELWYRGAQGEQERRRIQEEWTAAHAAAWRRWRIKEYLFVADRCAAQICTRLAAADQA